MGETTQLVGRIEHCDDIETFRNEILPALTGIRSQWKRKIQQILEVNHYSKSDLAKLCGVTRPAVAKWCAGSIPGNREDYIKIGFAAHYDYNEMNFFLQRYGRYPGLYPKSLEDSIYMYVLNSNDLEHTYVVCMELLENVRTSLGQVGMKQLQYEDTNYLRENLLSIGDSDGLYRFISKNAAIYKEPYNKFYGYVEKFIRANNIDAVSNSVRSVNSLAEVQGWSSSLRQCVSAIHKRKWFPLRRKVIILGLYLNMNVDQINRMLAYAQMEALCPKNPVESAILFAVTDADLNGLICQDGGTELCEYVRDVLKQLDIEGVDEMLIDL